MEHSAIHRLSVVIPIYQGEHTLSSVIAEIAPLTRESETASGRPYVVDEVLLVHDGASDRSDAVILALARQYVFIKPIWFARNFGQHPATIAGMASSGCPWVITMDEDGQQNPADFGNLLDAALDHGAQLVYALPRNAPPHGTLRNALSVFAKWIGVHVLGNKLIGRFNSFRLIEGEIARSLAAYCGSNVFLDVALGWIVGRVAYAPVTLRSERGHRSGYSLPNLARHFWRMLLTSGTKPLRFITIIGLLSMALAFLLSFYALWVKIGHGSDVQGWTSLVIVTSFFAGLTLFSLGIIAEYLAVALGIVMGRPLYVIMSQPPRDATKEI